MQILLVEDHTTMGPELVRSLKLMANVSRVDLVRSRDMALQALRAEFYDLMILDLGIPLTDDSTDAAPEHGQDLFRLAQESCPGLPIIVLTGSNVVAWAEKLGKAGNSVDLYGTNTPTHTVDFFRKENVDQVYGEVERIAAEVAAVNAIRLNTRGKTLDLSEGAQRALRVATRQLGGVNAEILPLSGGLSRVRVVRARVRDGAGAQIATLAAKLGDIQEVRSEMAAYDRYVNRLPIGAFPHRVKSLEAGLCGKGAILYRLAEDYAQTLFDLVAASPQDAVLVIQHLRTQVKPWIDGATLQRLTIADIRRHVLWDDEFTDLKAKHGLNVDDIEAMTVDVRVGCAHGDLHGGNVLIGHPPSAIVIDFGEVGEMSLCLDPLTLELSTVFHPDGTDKSLVADLPAYLTSWPDAGALPTEGIGPYLKACRDWAYDVAHDDLSVLASAYAYAVRQLRFKTVPPEKTLLLVESVANALRAAR